MPYRHIARELGEIEVAEDIRNETKTLVNVKVRPVTVAIYGHNACPLLPAVLLSVETEVCEVCCLWVFPYPHEATLIVKFV